ncbi:MAG TPA: alkaline phosphatase family protein [Thermoplasmata archaeon]|nr:alkaline phosphatase family protein [Thermoplasmata archaeon]
MAAERFALVILDGLGDRPHPDTGGVSPVEAASTPNLDRLVARGSIGRVTVVGPGIAPESDAGVFALLGYDPVTDSPGRGVLEALGVGLDLAAGDVALRLNFATADGTGAILDSRVGRTLTTEQSRSLAEALTRADLLHDEGIRAEVRATVGHRGVLWLRPIDGRPLSKEVSNSDPFYEKVGGMGQARKVTDPRPLPVHPLDQSPSAARTAAAIDRFLALAGPVLAGHSVNARRAMAGQKVANSLLVRNAGALPEHPVRSFQQRHGLAGAAVTEMPVERGIARCLGLVDRFVGPMGRDRDAALADRAKVTLDALRATPFVYVHLKGPDEPGHDGDARAKRDIVEALDRSFFGPFVAGADWATTRVAVTADHATPCIVKGHSDDPVPLVLAGAGVGAAAPSGKFGEPLAARGALGDHRGAEVVDLLLGRTAASR